jgi:hypothetical protein
LSIELWNELQELKARVAELERVVAQLGPPDLMLPAIPRKRPGPPKGFKRQPKQVISG